MDDAPARWVALADQIDRRLTAQSDWPALAEMLQHAKDAGHDVTALTRRLVADSPLGEMPAQELRYRLVVWLPEPNPFEREEAARKTDEQAGRPAGANSASQDHHPFRPVKPP